MKYKSFRNLVLLGFAVLVVAGIWALSNRPSSKLPEAVAARPSEAPAQPAATPVPAVASASVPASVPASQPSQEPGALRPMDTEILARVKQGISGDKEKDALRGRSYKVNLYKDTGSPSVNRLKIDLNRNEKWEEKWTFKNEGGSETVKRQVAPNDDEKYTEEYLLENGKWVKTK